jgi:glycosyltransferase involved in cell wall biosynthesis
LDGVTGFTVPPADPDALATALNRLLNDQESRCTFGDAARRRVETVFSANKMTESMMDLYTELLSSRVRVLAPAPGAA